MLAFIKNIAKIQASPRLRTTSVPRSDQIVIVDDDPRILELQREILNELPYPVRSFKNPLEAWEYLSGNPVSVVVTDWQMPGMTGLDLLFKTRSLPQPPKVIVLTGHGTVSRAVSAMLEGAFHFLEKPFASKTYLETVRRAVSNGDGAEPRPSRMHKPGVQPPEPVWRSKAMAEALELAAAAAETDSAILLLGESGTGKEVLADFVHYKSARAAAPMIKVNCGALPENLIESELFGHEKGAFTGADKRRAGRFEQAKGGTIFLDEIGELPLDMQVKLLRVLQDKQIERLGGDSAIQLDFRLIAATNRDISLAMREGKFREDLYYRINIMPITLPPLRERSEDIKPLAEHFFEMLRGRMERGPGSLSREALECLERFGWPGNIRQLRNAIEYALVVCREAAVAPKHLPKEVAAAVSGALPTAAASTAGLNAAVGATEEQAIRRALEAHSWNIPAVLDELKISRSTLYDRLKHYGIERPPKAG